MNLKTILSFQFLNNNIESWLTAVIIALSIIVFGKFSQYFISRWFKGWAKFSKTSVDDFIVSTLESLKWEWMVIGLFVATRYLNFSESTDVWILWVFVFVLIYKIIRVVNSFLDYFTATVFLEKKTVDSGSKGAIKHIVLILKIGVAGVLTVVALDNLGFNIGALVAGLGVTGIIIGLAVQNIVGDLFSSFCIVFDKPFEVGDFIIVGDFMGMVQSIGIKTTRLTSLGGEQLVFSNSDLTGSRIRNYKRMTQRRIVFGFGVEYGTEEEKLKSIPAAVRAIIDDIEDTTCDRAHFKKFGDSSLNFEVVYYVLSADYTKYMDIQERINFEIFSKFHNEGINFAFPTQTLHVKEHNVVQQTW